MRDEQSEQTRERILKGLTAALAKNPNDVSIPQVARLAKVAVPTVYRHFSSKQALFDGLREEVELRLKVNARLLPSDIDSLFPALHEFFEGYEGLGPELFQAAFSPIAQADRLKRAPARLAWIERVFEKPLAKIPASERVLLRDTLAVLLSGSALRAYKDNLGLSAAEAAERVEWTVRTLIAKKKRSSAKEKSK